MGEVGQDAVVVDGAAEDSASGARVGEPSREHGFRALRHFYASEAQEAVESIVPPARRLGHSGLGLPAADQLLAGPFNQTAYIQSQYSDRLVIYILRIRHS
ncbi:hypothetical protein [Streptomyces sp. SudanB182_2057]|uniref:hypothetical protein n=1 Tax=Streptomyces sp. SudanB182_2057 TaxID=3035281 RepID=UPI003F5800C9